jgi:ABC-type branched-subunit amino acid transport system substrate-binding protein
VRIVTNASRSARPGRRFVPAFAATQPGVPGGVFPVYAAAATEVLLSAIAHSDGNRASVTRQLIASRPRDGIAGPMRFDRNGEVVAPAVTIMRLRAPTGVSDVRFHEGAAVDRTIAPPPWVIR